MKSNYRKLNGLIEEVDYRNKKLEVETLLGVSVRKVFIPSIANTVGTDFKKYKIIKKKQFCFIPDTSRRGDKIGIAMLSSHHEALVSQAYKVFEIIDQNELSPEYLMMWFARPEFDRYARYKSHGSVREIFDWEEMCEVELPIPPIEEQQAIVTEYKTVTDRIELNKQINTKLEETAQALYRHWFVDFEFPDENGKSYKSSGGKMVYNEKLEKEVPEGWEAINIGDVVDNLGGGTPKTEVEDYWEDGSINWFSPTDVTKSQSVYLFNSSKKITEVGLNNSSAKIFPVDSLLMTSRATIGKLGINKYPSTTNQGFITLIPNNNYPLYYLIEWLKSNVDLVDQLASGSTFREISKSDFRQIKILKTNNLILKFSDSIIDIYKKIEVNSKLLIQLESTRSLLLSKMAGSNAFTQPKAEAI